MRLHIESLHVLQFAPLLSELNRDATRVHGEAAGLHPRWGLRLRSPTGLLGRPGNESRESLLCFGWTRCLLLVRIRRILRVPGSRTTLRVQHTARALPVRAQ